MPDFTPEALNAAGRELMAVTICGHQPETEQDREGFRFQWDTGGFKGQRDAWIARAHAVLTAAEPHRGQQ